MCHQNFSIELHSASDIQANNRAVNMKLFVSEPSPLQMSESGVFSLKLPRKIKISAQLCITLLNVAYDFVIKVYYVF